MSDQHEEHEQRGYLALTAFVFVLPVLYVFGAGPIVWAVSAFDPHFDGPLSHAVGYFYLPLNYLYLAAGEPEWFAAYIDWWTK